MDFDVTVQLLKYAEAFIATEFSCVQWLSGELIECWVGSMDWIDLAQNWDMWQALVNALMNLWFP